MVGVTNPPSPEALKEYMEASIKVAKEQVISPPDVFGGELGEKGRGTEHDSINPTPTGTESSEGASSTSMDHSGHTMSGQTPTASASATTSPTSGAQALSALGLTGVLAGAMVGMVQAW